MSSISEYKSTTFHETLAFRTESVMILVDYDNLVRSFRNSIPGIAGAYIDFDLMKRLLAQDRYVAGARVYSGFEEGCPISKGLSRMLDCGYELYLEPIVSGHQKGVDMSMGIDAVEYARQNVCDTILLVTGDGDLGPAARRIKQYGVKVQVASFRNSLSNCLIEEADEIIILDMLRMVDACNLKTKTI